MNRLALLFALTACGTDYATPGTPDPTDPGAPDAGTTTYTELAPPTQGFQVKTPEVKIQPGQEVTYCYYFHTPNTAQTVVKSWQSRMTPGSHHMILYFTGTAEQPDGTLDPSGSCGGMANTQNLPIWTYLAQSADNTAAMPTNDGTGKPVGMAVPAGQAAVMQMHYLNSGEEEISVHVTLNANAHDAGVAYTPAAAFVTYNSRIDIPAGDGQMATAQGSCTVSPNQKFFTMTTHSHKQSTETMVRDGGTMIVDSLDWEHATVRSWDGTPFLSFASGKLDYQCNYTNHTNNEIKAGPSAQTNEMCMAIGYNFPATKSTICLNSFVAPQ